jgi:hypothetical protein
MPRKAAKPLVCVDDVLDDLIKRGQAGEKYKPDGAMKVWIQKNFDDYENMPACKVLKAFDEKYVRHTKTEGCIFGILESLLIKLHKFSDDTNGGWWADGFMTRALERKYGDLTDYKNNKGEMKKGFKDITVIR